MTEITVRVLDESDWSVYRDVRLRALAEYPGSFTATLAEEAGRDEQFWRDRMIRSTGCWPNEARYRRESSASNLTSRSPQRGRSSACMSSQGHGVPGSLGVSLRLRRLWRPNRLTCGSTTGCGPTMGERSALLRTSGSALPITVAHRAAPTSNRVRRLPWCCRWSQTPPWRRTRPAGSQPRAKALSAETWPGSSLRPPKALLAGRKLCLRTTGKGTVTGAQAGGGMEETRSAVRGSAS
jgi:hypothetical protein